MSGRATEEPIHVYFGDILVKSEDENGNLIVSGKAAGPDLDLDHQILDPDWLASAMPAWFDTGGNIRLQHDMYKPVGKATSHTEKTDGHWITAKIVDPEAQKLVREEVLTGFSVGIKNPRVDMSTKALAKATGGIVKGGTVVETSIVDRACNSACVLTLAKAAKPETAVLPEGVEPQTDKGLIRTEEIVKVSTSAGHSHAHTHEDGAHEHAHPHSPLDGHYQHDDKKGPVPHEHAHDPKDPPRAEEAGSTVESATSPEEDLAEPARDEDKTVSAGPAGPPLLDGGPQSTGELHKAAMARLEAKGFVVDVPKAAETTAPVSDADLGNTSPAEALPEPTGEPEPAKAASASVTVDGSALSLEQLQTMIAEAVEKAAKTDKAKPHAFVDDDGDGKCDTCGEKREDGMHHKSFKSATADAAKAVPNDPKLESCIADLYGSKDMKSKYPKDEDRKSHAIAICRAALDKVAGKTAEPDLAKKDYSTETRIEMAKKGQAIPIRNDKGEVTGGRYPIADGGDLDDAVKSFGRGSPSDADEVKAYIKKRAKALGLTDKIPGEWKVMDYDLAKALLGDLLTKDASEAGGDKPDHTEAYAQACAGLAALIQNEAQELADGEDEYWSLYCLLNAVQGLRSWRQGEVQEGEMEPMDLGRPVYMEAIPDLLKAVQGLPALVGAEVAKALRPKPVEKFATQEDEDMDTEALLSAMRAEIAKAMKPLEGIEALSGKIAAVEATVEKIAKAPQANGPRRLGAARAPVSNPVNEHREKAAYLRQQASATSNITMRDGYLGLAADEEAKAADLEKRAEAAG